MNERTESLEAVSPVVRNGNITEAKRWYKSDWNIPNSTLTLSSLKEETLDDILIDLNTWPKIYAFHFGLVGLKRELDQKVGSMKDATASERHAVILENIEFFKKHGFAKKAKSEKALEKAKAKAETDALKASVEKAKALIDRMPEGEAKEQLKSCLSI